MECKRLLKDKIQIGNKHVKMKCKYKILKIIHLVDKIE